jgi:sugar fermentation stimulation protein A
MMRPSTPIHGPLALSRFLQRYNRFLIQVRLDDTGEAVDVHMADPGRLRELLLPGKRIWIRPAENPRRKTRWTAVLVESPCGRGLVGLDTTLPNRLISEALRRGALEEFRGWRLDRAEFLVGRSRLDFLLSHEDGRKLALEVKSVTLVKDGLALFPDAVTERGARHLSELKEIAGQPAWDAAVLFMLQRWDGRGIRAAGEIDLRFAEALEEAHAAGVRILGRRCRVGMEKVELGPPVPVYVG